MNFFEGKGYNSEFTENMRNIIDTLDNTNPFISITENADIICSKCPHNNNGICTSEKVSRYDRAVLNIGGLENGSIVKWSDLKEISGYIISCGLENICGDCQWFGICRK